LAEDVPVLTARLHALGDIAAKVVVEGNSVVVQGGGPLPAPPSFFVRYGHFSLRPVLCGAPAFITTTDVLSGPLPSCGAQYQTTASNLATQPSSNASDGFTSANIPPDPSFAAYPSTPDHDADEPSTTVLLSTDPTAGSQQYTRFVLGPAQMEGKVFASVTTAFDRNSVGWVVVGTMTPSNSALYDEVTHADFHQYMAIDLDGLVLSAPLIQPVAESFASFQGKFEISANFTKTTAREVAALLLSGPLPAPLLPR
jgi:hypothetical protein